MEKAILQVAKELREIKTELRRIRKQREYPVSLPNASTEDPAIMLFGRQEESE